MNTEEAIRYARENEYRTLLILPGELVQVAQGCGMMFALDDGEHVMVRVPTAEEYLAEHVQRRADQGLPPMITAAQAERLARPLPHFATGS